MPLAATRSPTAGVTTHRADARLLDPVPTSKQQGRTGLRPSQLLLRSTSGPGCTTNLNARESAASERDFPRPIDAEADRRRQGRAVSTPRDAAPGVEQRARDTRDGSVVPAGHRSLCARAAPCVVWTPQIGRGTRQWETRSKRARRMVRRESSMQHPCPPGWAVEFFPINLTGAEAESGDGTRVVAAVA
jgi:hypothetical protein